MGRSGVSEHGVIARTWGGKVRFEPSLNRIQRGGRVRYECSLTPHSAVTVDEDILLHGLGGEDGRPDRECRAGFVLMLELHAQTDSSGCKSPRERAFQSRSTIVGGFVYPR